LLLLAPLGFICACIAAATTMALSLFGFESDAEFLIPFFATVTVTTMWTGAIAILPATVAIVLGEAFAWRSVLYYFLAGGVIALIADRASDLAIAPDFPGRRLVIMLAAGFVGGFVYWVLAGQRAGDWGPRGTPPRAPAEEGAGSAEKSDLP
jgi:hypothetical protein